MLQFPLKLQEAANGEFALQVPSKEVRGERRAAAACLQGVSCGGAVTVPHAHAGLGTNDALDLQTRSVSAGQVLEVAVYFQGAEFY